MRGSRGSHKKTLSLMMSERRIGECCARLAFALLCACACDKRAEPVRVQQSEPTVTQRPRAVSASEEPLPTVEAISHSRAAGVKLIVAASGWTLVTAEGLYRKQDGKAPVHRSTGINPPLAVMGERVVHWGDGQLLATPLSGAPPSKLGALEQMPRDVFASTEHFTWLQRSKLGDRILVADKLADKPGSHAAYRTVYRSEHGIVSGAMLQDWVFFVESLPDGEWRLGAASIGKAETLPKQGQAATLGPAREGRPPAFLLAENELYFYDGPSRSVRRVTPDLQEETIVATSVICSPMAVARQVYCAHVGGVFSVSTQEEAEEASQRRVLESRIQGPITAIAASPRQVVWVEDVEGKQLRVRTVRLP